MKKEEEGQKTTQGGLGDQIREGGQTKVSSIVLQKLRKAKKWYVKMLQN